jgi:hypothetical protein
MADEPLADHYVRCTTKRISGKMPPTEGWWFVPGDPLLLIEYRASDLAALPRRSQLVRTLDFANITLSRCRVEYRSRTVGVWFLRTDENTDRDVLRRLRLHLCRLHSEIECLKQIFRAIIGKRLSVSRGTESNDLQEYLRKATRLLSRKESHGFRQLPILRAAMEAHYLVEPGDRENLLAELDRLRPNIVRNIKALTETIGQGQGRPGINIDHLDLRGGRFIMEEKSITVTGDGNILNVAEYMSQITNTVQQNINKSGAPANAKQMVKDLTDQLKEISSLIDPQLAKQLGDDVRVLSEEMARPTPRKEWYQFTLNGLKKAAETIGKIGEPILTIVGKLIPILV